MKNTFRHYAVFFLLAILAVPSFANTSQKISHARHLHASKKRMIQQTRFCPEVHQLVYDPMTKHWGISAWQSHAPSFAKKIIKFEGAQWVGVNVGHIICIYESDTRVAFPVTIHNTALVPMPKQGTGYWEKYVQGRKNCHATEGVKDCPFMIRQTEKPKDIYEQLNFFKNKPKR